jgi:hypothetical protein
MRLAELLQERLKAVAVSELADECVQYRSVHDESRNGQVPGPFMVRVPVHLEAGARPIPAETRGGPIPSPHPPSGVPRLPGEIVRLRAECVPNHVIGAATPARMQRTEARP